MIAGDNILKLTIPVLLEYEVLPSDDVDVNDHIFMANNDAGSNMVKAWEKFNGSTCAAHKLGRCCLAFLTVPAIYKIEMKVKGMAAHFHRSTKGLSVLLHNSTTVEDGSKQASARQCHKELARCVRDMPVVPPQCNTHHLLRR